MGIFASVQSRPEITDGQRQSEMATTCALHGSTRSAQHGHCAVGREKRLPASLSDPWQGVQIDVAATEDHADSPAPGGNHAFEQSRHRHRG